MCVVRPIGPISAGMGDRPPRQMGEGEQVRRELKKRLPKVRLERLPLEGLSLPPLPLCAATKTPPKKKEDGKTSQRDAEKEVVAREQDDGIKQEPGGEDMSGPSLFKIVDVRGNTTEAFYSDERASNRGSEVDVKDEVSTLSISTTNPNEMAPNGNVVIASIRVPTLIVRRDVTLKQRVAFFGGEVDVLSLP